VAKGTSRNVATKVKRPRGRPATIREEIVKIRSQGKNADGYDPQPDSSTTALERIERAIRSRRRPSSRALTSLLHHPDYEVRMRTAEALGILARGSAPPELLKTLRHDQDELVRIEAADSLGAIRDPQSRRVLRAALYDPSPLVRAYAASSLGEIGNTVDVRQLRRRLSTERQGQARAGLLHGLYSMGEKDVLPKLVRLLEHKGYRVRSTAAKLLAMLELPPADRRTVIVALRKASDTEVTPATASSLAAAVKSLTIPKRRIHRDAEGKRN